MGDQPVRETIKQRNARWADLMAHYDDVMAQLRKLDAEAEALKAAVRDIEPGVYNGWERADGTPREVMDQRAVQADYEQRRVEVPKMKTRPPLIVRRVATAPSGKQRRR